MLLDVRAVCGRATKAECVVLLSDSFRDFGPKLPLNVKGFSIVERIYSLGIVSA